MVIGKYFGWEISHFMLHDSWFGIVTFSNKHDSRNACLLMLVSKSSGGHFRFTLKRSEQQSTSQNTARINWWRTESRLLASASICVRSVVTTGRSFLQNDCTCVLQTAAPYPNVNLETSHAAYQIEWSHSALQSEFIKLNSVVKFLFFWNFQLLSFHRIISCFLCSLVSFRLLP